MEIIEEIGRRRQDIRLEDTDRAYAEIRDLLTSRISQDEVREEKYFNDVDTGKIHSKVILEEQMDKFTFEVHEIFVDINKQEKRPIFRSNPSSKQSTLLRKTIRKA